MRIVLVFFALLLAVRVVAQPAASLPECLPAAGPVATAAPPADIQATPVPDTVAALHRLFAHKRRQSGNLLGLSVVGSVAGVAAASQTVWSTDATVSALGITSFALAVYVALPVAAVEIGQLIRFNRRHEQQALDAFAAHRLPRNLKRKLKPRYFRPAHASA